MRIRKYRTALIETKLRSPRISLHSPENSLSRGSCSHYRYLHWGLRRIALICYDRANLESKVDTLQEFRAKAKEIGLDVLLPVSRLPCLSLQPSAWE